MRQKLARLDPPLRLGPVTVETPCLLCAVWCALLYRDTSGFLLLGLAASLLHEAGHVACYRLLCGRTPPLRLTLTGIALRAGEFLPAGQRLLLAAAGPGANLLLAALAAVALRRRFTLNMAAWCAANLLTGGFNLLPLPPLDGFALLRAAWELLFPER